MNKKFNKRKFSITWRFRIINIIFFLVAAIVLLLFNNAASFNNTLIFIVLSILVVYLVFISILSDRMFLLPFRKLLKTLDLKWEDGGYDLQNEFGEVFKTIEHTKLLLDMTPMSCTLWDKNLKIINTNQESLKLFEINNKDEFRNNFYSLSPEFQPSGRLSSELGDEWLKKTFEEGFFRLEWMHQLHSGELLPCEITLLRFQHRDEYVVASYARDLRQQKAHLAEMNKAHEDLRLSRYAAEAASRAKSEFLAVISDEIRTPMNSILGFAELALAGDFLPQIKEYLRKISESAKWLLNIVNDILDISKIESGKIELEYTPFVLQDVVSRCQSVIMPSVRKKDLNLRVYLEPLPGKKLVGDSIRLYQALMNLLSNAVKFTEAGTVKISSIVKKSEGNTALIYFEVKDSGIGITPEQIDKIFDPFIQGDSGTKRSHGGTGLGLAITKNIVHIMGGKLCVESSPGVGSLFYFEIEFNTVDDSVEKLDNYKAAVFDSALEKPHFEGLVLVCDDNPMNQEVIYEHLEQVGIKTVIAGNGYYGVEIVRERMNKNEKPFDLIFMDIFMPVMDGFEAAEQIIAMGTGTPVVAMTANVMTSELEKYRKAGMLECLGKPFTSQELWHILLKYFTPVSISVVDEDEHSDKELLEKLQKNFVKKNQNTYKKITGAISSGDISLAHRLVHTLKGNAGMIKKPSLQITASDVEALLLNGVIIEESMNLLKVELDIVLQELNPLLDDVSQKDEAALDKEQVLELFEKLESMLANINPVVADMVDDILAIPGTEALVRQIEDYDFEAAAKTLEELIENWR